MRAHLLPLLALTLTAGCSLEPAYQRPAAPVPPASPSGPAYATPLDEGVPSLSWRTLFRDRALQGVIDQALVNNRDLRIAAANVASARAQYRVQRADQFPRIGAQGGVSLADNASSSGNSSGGNGARTVYSLGVGLTSFELDLFGRLRSLSRAAFDQYLATAAGARSVRLALVAEVASAYFELAADRSALAVAAATARNAERLVSLTDQRRAAGISSRIDLSQARTVRDTARADVANFTTEVAQDRNVLELLVGAPLADGWLPASIESVDDRFGALPTGLSSTVLLRRPDVVEAELQLMAANARIGAARAAFFPTISLTGALGFASTALSKLFSGGAFEWSAGPGATLPLFDAGANRGNLAYARAQRDLFVAQYERAIQTAFREVADALARRGTIDAQLAARQDNVAAALENYRLSDARYRAGIDNFLVSLDAQRTLYSAQQALAAARLLRADSVVALYRAIGGDELTDPDGVLANP